MKYIILLRGINISGKNKISMSELKQELENLGYSNVITHLNSGNIILTTNKNEDEIISAVGEMIKNKFSLDIPVFVIKSQDLEELVANKPSWWHTQDKEIYDNIIFILKPHTFKEVSESLGKPNSQNEQIKEYKNNIFWSYKLSEYRKTNWWSKTASTNIKDFITIRTSNTILKLLDLTKGENKWTKKKFTT